MKFWRVWRTSTVDYVLAGTIEAETEEQAIEYAEEIGDWEHQESSDDIVAEECEDYP